MMGQIKPMYHIFRVRSALKIFISRFHVDEKFFGILYSVFFSTQKFYILVKCLLNIFGMSDLYMK